MKSKLFTPAALGPLILRNRTIRAAAFEGMALDNNAAQPLCDYHTAVAAGGIGMTTLAYAAVDKSGLSFPRQLWMRKETIPGLRKIADAVHREGAALSVQIGHCGNMSHKSICGCKPVSCYSGFNLYSPTFVRALRTAEVREMAAKFGEAVHIAHEGGLDAVEVHAGHGYLLSQFMSTKLNHRKDEYGGSFANRLRFTQQVMDHVMEAASHHNMAVTVKMNMRDGFKGGMELEESMEVAKCLEQWGAHGLVLSGGYVSRAPMYVMRGAMPIKTLTHYMPFGYLKYGVLLAGRYMIPTVPYSEAYFLEDAIKFRQTIKIPLIYVGGLVSRSKIDEVLDRGFEFVSMARALVNDPAFVNRMKEAEAAHLPDCVNGCCHVNYCIGRMYTLDMQCHQHCTDHIPAALLRQLKKNEKYGG